jgi:hypothetical protein
MGDDGTARANASNGAIDVISDDVTFELGASNALEVITALVAFGAQDSTRRIRVVISARLLKVVKECAYLDIERLERAGRLVVAERDPQVTRIVYEGASITIEPALPVLSQLKLSEGCLKLPHAQDNIFARTARRHSERYRAVGSVRPTAALLIGTGPSLSSVDLSRYQRCLTIACNKIHLLPYKFEPKHIVFEDRVVTEDVFNQGVTFDKSRVWLPSDLSYLLPNEATVYPLDRYVQSFPSFSRDPAIAYSGWTVMFIMLQVAFWMGVQTVYLLGVDGYSGRPPSTLDRGVFTSTGEDDQHFHPSYYGRGQRFQAHQVEKVLAAYQLADEVYRDAGRSIVNCSRDSRVDAFVKGSLPAPEALA